MGRGRWTLALSAALLAALALSSPVVSQEEPKLRDFEAEWDDLEADLVTHTATLTGHVRLTIRKPRAATLTADVATLQLDKSHQTVLQAEATGNVEFNTTTATTTASPARRVDVSCGKAKYDPPKTTVVLTGGPKASINALDEKAAVQKVSLTGGQMTYSLADEALTVSGPAHVEGLAAPTDKTGRQRIIADSETATFDQKAQKMVLRGSARMQFLPIPADAEGPTGSVEGEVIEYDMAQSKARVKGAPDKPGRLQFDVPPAEGEANP